ncbi:hypothetical protein MMC25_006340 [Agyrium rufum]|nr:hypothetical protein [Agyrium rufum]
MPCFKGLAVSIHTDTGALPEYSIQKQNRASRITAYIPVPPPKLPKNPGEKPEQSNFAISITLLTPGISVPYSTPKPTSDDPFPRPQIVGGLPGNSGQRGRYSSVIAPYIPQSSSPNETVAAYIYFDGRAKEEVATLLRRGEETWVNSRWVGVPESEGGGLAEREFLFREVGLERWLNGLDLSGKDVAAQIERRKQKMERKRRRRKIKQDHADSDEDGPAQWMQRDRAGSIKSGVLRYGADGAAPLQTASDDDDLLFSDSDSDDDPVPEATGQIKVALYRVLASGEIKKGEYSPQYDAHDDDDDFKEGGANGKKDASGSGDGDIDHTTSFAKPKSLDKNSISTQTVTGIDGPDKPYAVFTFLYRGSKQLQKMGILPSAKNDKFSPITVKRRSTQTDFGKLKPLKPGGTVGFTAFRDNEAAARSGSKKKGKDSDMDSDEDEDISDALEQKKVVEMESEDFQTNLSPEEVKKQGELADGVKQIKLKRQHSFENPTSAAPPSNPSNQNVGDSASTQTPTTTGQGDKASAANLNGSEPKPNGASMFSAAKTSEQSSTDIGSPMKKRRSSVNGHTIGSMDRVIETPNPPSQDLSGLFSRGPENGIKAESIKTEIKAESGVPSAGPSLGRPFGAPPEIKSEERKPSSGLTSAQIAEARWWNSCDSAEEEDEL